MRNVIKMQVIWTSAKGTKRVYIIRSHNPHSSVHLFASRWMCFTEICHDLATGGDVPATGDQNENEEGY